MAGSGGLQVITLVGESAAVRVTDTNSRNKAGVLGSTPERLTESASRLGVSRAYDSLDEMLADPDVAVVHNYTTNNCTRPSRSPRAMPASIAMDWTETMTGENASDEHSNRVHKQDRNV